MSVWFWGMFATSGASSDDILHLGFQGIFSLGPLGVIQHPGQQVARSRTKHQQR